MYIDALPAKSKRQISKLQRSNKRPRGNSAGRITYVLYMFYMCFLYIFYIYIIYVFYIYMFFIYMFYVLYMIFICFVYVFYICLDDVSWIVDSLKIRCALSGVGDEKTFEYPGFWKHVSTMIFEEVSI